MPLLSAHSTSQGDPHRLRRAESAQRVAGPCAPFWNSLSHGCLNRVLRSVPAFHPGSAERIPRLSGHAREKQRHPPSENGTSKLGRSICRNTESVTPRGGDHETVCIGRAAWELSHWHSGRCGKLVRLKRQREGAEREPAAIRLLPPTAAADRHWTHEEANGKAGIGSPAWQESVLDEGRAGNHCFSEGKAAWSCRCLSPQTRSVPDSVRTDLQTLRLAIAPGKRARLGAPRVRRVRTATAAIGPCTLARRRWLRAQPDGGSRGPRLGGYLAPPVMLARFECIFLNEKTSELGGSLSVRQGCRRPS